MTGKSATSTISSVLLLLICVSAAAREFGEAPALSVISAMCLLAFIVLEWPRLATVTRILIGVSLGAFAAIWLWGTVSADLLERAVSRAAFFTFFLCSLNFLRDAAQTSPLVQRCGKVIVNQPPGRRYAVLTIGGHFLAS